MMVIFILICVFLPGQLVLVAAPELLQPFVLSLVGRNQRCG